MRTFIAALLLCLFSALPALADKSEEGIASTYANGDGHEWSQTAHCWKVKRRTRCERVNPWGLTAAHRTLPFNTRVKVTNKRTHKSVIVRINDRGPFKRGRVIDLTPAAAERIGSNGLAHVTISAPLVEKARAYLGKTAAQLGLPRSLWCADFVAKIAPEVARKVDNPRWARDYAALPKTGPQVGAIAVLSRGRGGHIGIVSGFDSRGNPVIISGNHGHRVAEGTYPKGRVIAYVSGG